MSTLLASCFRGEFGWTLFGWQAHLRHISKGHKEIIVIGRPHEEFLYRDFCTKYVPFDPGGSQLDRWYNNDGKSDKSLVKQIKAKVIIDGSRFDIQYRHNYKTGIAVLSKQFKRQVFIQYGNKDPDLHYDLLIHSRSVTRFKTRTRNWPIENWNQMVGNYGDCRIASVGTIDGADHIEGTDDLRGIPLEELANVMASSSVILGPSSGTMHYASLCGLPQIVWSEPHNERRYKEYWNPFKTSVEFVGKWNWQPPAKEIIRVIENMICK